MIDLGKIIPPHEKSDMILVATIPALIRGDEKLMMQQILKEPLWYSDKTNQYSQVFWTENHYIMSVSSEYILYKFLEKTIDSGLIRRLHGFLDLKIRVGMAEFLSPVYYPFTIASLLNLFDYSMDEEIREKANLILNRITVQLLYFTLSDGSMISPSARSYSRHRENSYGQHIHQFINFILNRAMIENDQALYHTLSTTSWRPDSSTLIPWANINLSLSPSLHRLTHELNSIVGKDDVDMDMYISLLWMYGVYIPPRGILRKQVIAFMDRQNLWEHPHFQSLKTVRHIMCCYPTLWIGTIADTCVIRSYVKGLWLVGAGAMIYREGGVILSSLSGYNEGLPCFQQWPWMVNVAGVVVWCGFDDSRTISLIGNPNAESSSARILPRIWHDKNHLTATYRAQSPLLRLINYRYSPHVRWPVNQFDEVITIGTGWTIGRKNTAVVAFRIRQRQTVEVVVRDLAIVQQSIKDFQARL
jgi:hypothetical protein